MVLSTVDVGSQPYTLMRCMQSISWRQNTVLHEPQTTRLLTTSAK